MSELIMVYTIITMIESTVPKMYDIKITEKNKLWS